MNLGLFSPNDCHPPNNSFDAVSIRSFCCCSLFLDSSSSLLLSAMFRALISLKSTWEDNRWTHSSLCEHHVNHHLKQGKFTPHLFAMLQVVVTQSQLFVHTGKLFVPSLYCFQRFAFQSFRCCLRWRQRNICFRFWNKTIAHEAIQQTVLVGNIALFRLVTLRCSPHLPPTWGKTESLRAAPPWSNASVGRVRRSSRDRRVWPQSVSSPAVLSAGGRHVLRTRLTAWNKNEENRKRSCLMWRKFDNVRRWNFCLSYLQIFLKAFICFSSRIGFPVVVKSSTSLAMTSHCAGLTFSLFAIGIVLGVRSVWIVYFLRIDHSLWFWTLPRVDLESRFLEGTCGALSFCTQMSSILNSTHSGSLQHSLFW